jgi:hypothetical protein
MSAEAEPRPPEPPHPDLAAMLVCDQVIRDQLTGKASVIGIFDRIFAAAFPATHARLTVYVSVRDAEGDYRLRLDMVRIRDGMTVGRADAPITVGDRFSPAELVFELMGLRFDESGPYEFRLWANDRYVGLKSFSVLQLQGGLPHA